jgi:hypothetical protein
MLHLTKVNMFIKAAYKVLEGRNITVEASWWGTFNVNPLLQIDVF